MVKLDVTVNINAVRWLTTVVTADNSYIRADQHADVEVCAALRHMNSCGNTTEQTLYNRSTEQNMGRELRSSGLLYTASGGNFLPTFRDKLSGPIFRN